MTGLRERKKAQTREKIVLEAKQLFRKNGFEETLIEEIASQAVVSEGTVYNYFPTKTDILFATLEADTAHFVSQVQSIANSKSRSFKSATIEILDTFFDLIDTVDKGALRQFAYAPSRPSELFVARYSELNRVYTEALVGMYSRLQKADKLSKKVKVAALSRLVFNLADAELTNLVLNDNLTSDDAKRAIRQQVDILVTGVTD
eukprot:s1_g217.t1